MKAEDTYDKGFKAGYEEGMKSQATPRTDLECELADEEFRKELRIARTNTNLEFYQAGQEESDKKWRLIIKDTATVAKCLGIKEVVEWGDEECPHPTASKYGGRKRDCPYCWQSLRKEWGL